ncbi:hypothetical protein Ancab_010167 [Ancistrocladus abbreviatus]
MQKKTIGTTTTNNHYKLINKNKLASSSVGIGPQPQLITVTSQLEEKAGSVQNHKDMSKLFTSLRALLPPEHIKGKRSVCDHIMEAANYVKNLQKSIKQLETKRVALKRTSESSEFSQCQVDVHSCSGGGMEVKISVGVREAIRLSRFLSVLLEEGLDVVSCVSTKANKRWLHIIHAQVGNSSCIDPSWLQQRLTSKVCPRVP